LLAGGTAAVEEVAVRRWDSTVALLWCFVSVLETAPPPLTMGNGKTSSSTCAFVIVVNATVFQGETKPRMSMGGLSCGVNLRASGTRFVSLRGRA